MKKRYLGVGVAVIAVAVVVIAVRAIRGRDWLSGANPATLAAERENPDLEFELVPDPIGIYRVLDRRTNARGWFRLQLPLRGLTDGEKLTGLFYMTPCERVLPRWLPAFPKAHDVVCSVADTQLGERRFASLTVDAADLEEASEFYSAAMRKVPEYGEVARSTSGLPGVDWRGYFGWVHADDIRRVTIAYFSDRWLPPALVVITLSEQQVEQ